MEQTDVMARQAADAEEMRWGPWVEWKGGECPIPHAKAGEWECRCASVLALIFCRWNGADERRYAAFWGHLYPKDDFNITAYRVLKTVTQLVDEALRMADELSATIDRNEAQLEKAALPLPQSDLPGIAKQQAWLAAQPVPVPPPAPAPKEHPGLATVAPLSGRVGGRWGV
jgi:hypothetical protein